MKRISYTTHSSGRIVSNLIPLQTKFVYAFINADTLSYEIRSIENDQVTVLFEENGTSLRDIKSKVRNKLVQLGVSFEFEIRKKIGIT